MSTCIWTQEKTDTLIKWWPHWGTPTLAIMLNLNHQQVKSKVNKLKLIFLPKEQCLCVVCKIDYQSSKNKGIYCEKCFKIKRRISKGLLPTALPKNPLKQWIGRRLGSLRFRSKLKYNEPSDLSIDFLFDLWNKQNGLCFYSGRKLEEPIGGQKRNENTASLDRLDTNHGYTKHNVVWCTWICNNAKSNMSTYSFLELCSSISENKNNIQNKLLFNHST